MRGGVGDFWSSRIFFSSNLVGGIFFSITFVLHAIFFFRQALAWIFFSKSSTPALRVKWSAPKLAPKLPCSSTSSWASLLFRAARASRVTWSKRRSWENAAHVVQTKNKQISRWMEKVSYFLQRFLYGFKSTLQKENVQLKKVLNWPQKRFNTWNVSCGV